MTEQEQQIAIAKVCGWKLERCPQPSIYKVTAPTGNWRFYDLRALPDYLHDLNAMHEAEKSLTLDQQCAYSKLLHGIKDKPFEDLGAIFADASQRAEAFLRCLNLWKK